MPVPFSRTCCTEAKYCVKWSQNSQGNKCQHSKNFRFILSNPKLARAVTSTPKAVARINTGWDGLSHFSEKGCNFTSNFPVPSPVKVSGDRVTNWEFFRRQWQDYELGTGLEHRPEPVRLATLRSVKEKDCLQIFLNLKLTPEERASVSSSLAALEKYFKPKTNVVYERFLFNLAMENPE